MTMGRGNAKVIPVRILCPFFDFLQLKVTVCITESSWSVDKLSFPFVVVIN